MAENNNWYINYSGAETDTFRNAQRAADNSGQEQRVHRHKHGERCPGFMEPTPCPECGQMDEPPRRCSTCHGQRVIKYCQVLIRREDFPIRTIV